MSNVSILLQEQKFHHDLVNSAKVRS